MGATTTPCTAPISLVAATGATREDCEREMREAIAFHIEGLMEDSAPVPEALQHGGYAVVEVA